MSDQERLLKEYEVNVQLWFHADMLRQKRVQNFLTINAGLLAVLGAALAFKPRVELFTFVAVTYSWFGIIICLVWKRTSARNNEYVRIHRYQLRQIEKKLPGLSTFENIWNSLYEFKAIDFGNSIGTFVAKSRLIISRSKMTESSLPTLVLLFWIILECAAIMLALFPALIKEFSNQVYAL